MRRLSSRSRGSKAFTHPPRVFSRIRSGYAVDGISVFYIDRGEDIEGVGGETVRQVAGRPEFEIT